MPAYLPRVEIVVDIDNMTCPCCQGELHRIGEDKSERLDIVPAQFRVLITRRPKYACRRCEDGVVQALAPARLIEGGMPTEATIAQVLVSKYADHLPLCRKRIEEIFGWIKSSAGLAKIKLRGRARVDAAFTLALAAYNLIRLPKLLAVPI